MKNLSQTKGHWVGMILVGAVMIGGCAPIRPSVKRNSLRTPNPIEEPSVQSDNSNDSIGVGGPGQSVAATAQGPAPAAAPVPTPSPSPTEVAESWVQIVWRAKPSTASGNQQSSSTDTEPSDEGFVEVKLTPAELRVLKNTGEIQLPAESPDLKLLEVAVILNRTELEVQAIDPVENQWVLNQRKFEMAPTSDRQSMLLLLKDLDSVTLLFRRQEVLVSGNESLNGGVH